MILDKMIEINPLVDLKVIKETLTRIGIIDRKNKIIYPSCYLYEKFGKYYIVHFKELFILNRDDGYNNMSEEDINRKKSIVWCLKNWKLITCSEIDTEPHTTYISIIPHYKKAEYQISHKYNRFEIGENNE
jgi:hypothetical protein